MYKCSMLLTILLVSYVNSQNIVNRVRVLNHDDYMFHVIQEVVKTLEERGWWNLRLLEFNDYVNTTIFNESFEGTVTYKNGFLVGVQTVDVLQESLNQVWSVVPGDGTTNVEIRGQLRLTDPSLGYDIDLDLLDGTKRAYTGIITHLMVTLDFSIFRNVNRETMSVTVRGGQDTSVSRIIDILPLDQKADTLSTLFDRTKTLPGIQSWTEELKTIAEDVIANRVEFPGFCYNCV